MESPEIKKKVANTLKWSTLDKVASQVLYAVTGIVLAIMLPKEAFGIVGAAMVFQAVALLFVDSGFANALVQRKQPSDLDYSTVFWFNMAMAWGIYVILFFLAPLLADIFQGEKELIPISRALFLTLPLMAFSIVQNNRFVKRMDMRAVALANSLALSLGAVAGVALALAGWGAWAIVWQNVVTGIVRAVVLWTCSRWRPQLAFSFRSLRSMFKVGAGVMGQAALNVLFQNIYGLIIGNRNGMVSLAYYSQADKWSKMGVSSISQIFNMSFLPVLSSFQDDPRQFASATAKMNRAIAYVLFPGLGFLAIMAEPIFHALFHTKWDNVIPLFQLLLVRGVFIVLASHYNNYLLALGRARLMVVSEVVRDVLALAAIIVTLPYLGWSTDSQPVQGLIIFIWGQILAAFAGWAVTLVMSARLSWRTWPQFILDLLPYLSITAVAAIPMMLLPRFIANPWLLLTLQGIAGAAVYLGLNALMGSKVQKDVLTHFFHLHA